MTDAASIFQQHAPEYEAARRRLVPSFDAFYGTAAAAVPERAKTVLDLGAGTGLLAAMVAAARPSARLTLVDGAPAMLDQARGVLGERVTYAVGDLAGELPAGPWCAIVSALAIHHLDDAGKRALFARARAAIKPGGVFVNADQIAGPTPALDARYRAWHEARARAAGSSEAEWRAAEERMRVDRCAPLEDQLRWLREAGFEHVDCRFADHRFAVMVGEVAR
jgi:tRNA (cmo5U34)-methyltransferase